VENHPSSPVAASVVPAIDPYATFELVFAGDVAVIRASGEIDTHSARTLDTICDSLIVPGVPLVVRLDAAAVTFIDCGGVRGIVAVSDRIREAGGSFAVTTPSDRVAWLLDLCRIDLGPRVTRPAQRSRRGRCRTRIPRSRPGT
jgi:anti-anti-sigma factor